MFIGDIRKLNIEDVRNELGDIDKSHWSPPCQGFSVAGKRDVNDQRNTLPLEFIKYVDYFKPKIFVMENVKGLISMDKGRVLKHFIERFEAIGYKVKYELLNCADYEIPQTRERIFVVGVKKILILNFLSFKKQNNDYFRRSNRRYRTSRHF